MGLAKELFECFRGQGKFSLKDAYLKYPDKPKESIRARIYENLGIRFERAAAGVYCTCSGKEGCLVLEGDGRDLSFLKDESIDCILTDHPWEDEKSNKGGNRAFSKYPCFRYTEGDFREKARVLKNGCFLAEILTEENWSNYQDLYG
ncbi:MAG: site-specific DNA-methyltransferase, partial [Dorea sp.]|nr:site-specific DNA-methyltransferase [Dorea sp.]